MHVVTYFFRRGLLTEAEARDAMLYVGVPTSSRRGPDGKFLKDETMSILTTLGDIEDKGVLRFHQMEFKREQSRRFSDWIVINKKHDPVLLQFLRLTIKNLAIPAARRLNQDTRQAHAKAFSYYHDSVCSHALNLIFGETYRRIIRIESWERGPDVSYYSVLKRKRVTRKLRPENGGRIVTRNTVIINGHFRVVVSDLVMGVLESESDQFYIIGKHKHAEGCYTMGRKVRKGSSIVSLAIGVSRSCFVQLEVGDESSKFHVLLSETAESKRSRDIDRSYDPIEAARAFCESLDDRQMAAILMTEHDRPASETNAFDFYVARTGDKLHVGSFYKKLARGKGLLQDFLVENMFEPTYSKKIMTRQFRNSRDNRARYQGLMFGEPEVVVERKPFKMPEIVQREEGNSEWAVSYLGYWFGKYGIIGICSVDVVCEYADRI